MCDVYLTLLLAKKNKNSGSRKEDMALCCTKEHNSDYQVYVECCAEEDSTELVRKLLLKRALLDINEFIDYCFETANTERA